MATCDNCGKKLGLLDSKYNYEDLESNNGKSLTYCGPCSSKFVNKKQEKTVKLYEQETSGRTEEVDQGFNIMAFFFGFFGMPTKECGD